MSVKTWGGGEANSFFGRLPYSSAINEFYWPGALTERWILESTDPSSSTPSQATLASSQYQVNTKN